MSDNHFEEKEKYPGFPKVRDRCPNCGCPDREMESMVKGEKEKGRLDSNAQAFLQIWSTGVMDPKRAQILGAPILTMTSFVDACCKCGTLYVVRAQRGETVLKAGIPGAPRGPMMPPQPPRAS